MLRIVTLMVIWSCFSVGVIGQNNDWEKLKRISRNSPLIVEMKDGKTIKGYLVSMETSAMKLKDKRGETKLDRGSIRRVYEGVEKRKVPLWGRITIGVGVFFAVSIGSFAILRPDKVSDELNSLDMLGMVAATTGAALSGKLLGKIRMLKKGDLLYHE
ncbi:MAG: hypothetical protein ABIU09_07700 [Pyrinomonadaceae bacterium]